MLWARHCQASYRIQGQVLLILQLPCQYVSLILRCFWSKCLWWLQHFKSSHLLWNIVPFTSTFGAHSLSLISYNRKKTLLLFEHMCIRKNVLKSVFICTMTSITRQNNVHCWPWLAVTNFSLNGQVWMLFLRKFSFVSNTDLNGINAWFAIFMS